MKGNRRKIMKYTLGFRYFKNYYTLWLNVLILPFLFLFYSHFIFLPYSWIKTNHIRKSSTIKMTPIMNFRSLSRRESFNPSCKLDL